MDDVAKNKRKKRIPPFVWLWAAVLLAVIAFVARKVGAEPPRLDEHGVPIKGTSRPGGGGPTLRLAAKLAAPNEKGTPNEKAAGGEKAAPGDKPAGEKPPGKKPAAKDAGAPAAAPADAGADAGEMQYDEETMKQFKAFLEKAKPEPKSVFNEDPVDYAVAGPDGGVPTHEGTWKSPFAHPKYGTPANVRVGFLLANVRNYDLQKGTFEADFFLTLTSDKEMPPMDLIFTNGKQDLKEVMADKPTFKMYRFLGTFSSPLDLHDYPFDTQSLTMEIEDDDNGIDQIKLIPDEEHTNLDIGFEVPGWEVSFIQARVNTHNFPDRMDNDDLYYTRYQFVLGLKRFGTSAIFTVFVPAFVIVLISLTGLWITRDELEVRSNSTTPMLAAAVLFHYALIQSLPATAYLTRADKLMLSVYLILGLHMLGSLIWFFFDEKHTDTIFVWVRRAGIPLTFILLAGGVFL